MVGTGEAGRSNIRARVAMAQRGLEISNGLRQGNELSQLPVLWHPEPRENV